jgi:hypothetical protein
MERKAKTFFWGWLRFARLYLMEQVAMVNGLPYAGKEEELPEAAVINDEFFDFSEQDEKALNLTCDSLNSRKLGVIYAREGDAGLQNWVMNTVMGQLNGLHITCNASRSHVEELNRRLQKMEEDILLVQTRLGDGPFCKEWMVWRFAFTCIVAGVLFSAGSNFVKSAHHRH